MAMQPRAGHPGEERGETTPVEQRTSEPRDLSAPQREESQHGSPRPPEGQEAGQEPEAEAKRAEVRAGISALAAKAFSAGRPSVMGGSVLKASGDSRSASEHGARPAESSSEDEAEPKAAPKAAPRAAPKASARSSSSSSSSSTSSSRPAPKAKAAAGARGGTESGSSSSTSESKSDGPEGVDHDSV